MRDWRLRCGATEEDDPLPLEPMRPDEVERPYDVAKQDRAIAEGLAFARYAVERLYLPGRIYDHVTTAWDAERPMRLRARPRRRVGADGQPQGPS